MWFIYLFCVFVDRFLKLIDGRWFLGGNVPEYPRTQLVNEAARVCQAELSAQTVKKKGHSMQQAAYVRRCGKTFIFD